MTQNAPPPKDYGFFVGYFSKVPPSLAHFAVAVGSFAVAAFAAAGYLLAISTDAPQAAVFLPGKDVAGVYQSKPYPLIWMASDANHREGHTLLLSGNGKRGAQQAGAPFDGKAVKVTGDLLKRGTIDMLIVENFSDAGSTVAALAGPVQLGRWQISGEVCDGKCAVGAMKPGTGLAHKGCANLCIAGGLPPLLVTAEPVEGTNFVLLASDDGGPLRAGTWEDNVAVPVTLEGALERRGDLLILRLDWKAFGGKK